MYSTAGDRRDCDMIAQGKLLGEAFDRVILYEDHYLRGRPQGEIIALFRQGVQQGSRVKLIEELHGADAAVEAALRTAQPGDLMLVQADTVDETVQFIRRYVASLAPDAVSEESEAAAQAAGTQALAPPKKAVPAKNGDHGLLAPAPSVAKV